VLNAAGLPRQTLLLSRGDPDVVSLGPAAVYAWVPPTSLPVATYRVRATSPVTGVDASDGLSPVFTLRKPFTFVSTPFGSCRPDQGACVVVCAWGGGAACVQGCACRCVWRCAVCYCVCVFVAVCEPRHSGTHACVCGWKEGA
jgi:hypothetical protein